VSTSTAPPMTDPRTLPRERAPGQTSAYLLELEAVLNRVDSGTTYYQILGIDQTDDQEALRSSYVELLDLLFPGGDTASTLPADVVSRVERIFAKASQAFGVLASYTRRKEYDRALGSITSKPTVRAALRVPAKPAHSERARQDSREHDGSKAAPERQHSIVGPMPDRGQAFSESSTARTQPSSDNRRRCGRMKLGIPVRVTGHDQTNGKWNEMAETIDVSRTGARLRLRRRVKHGMVLFLSLPMPTKLRAHGFSEQGYNVYALVRGVDPSKKGVRSVGVQFLGEHPPAGFLDKPWAVYRAKRGNTTERRRHRREERNEAVVIEYLDELGQSMGQDVVRSENVGRYGLRVVGTAAPSEFDLVAVKCPRLHFDAMAALRDRYRGKDGLERLCLNLVDREWPLR
jgi:hypothetical protein